MIFPTFKSDKLNWNINVIIWLQFANESPFLWNIRLNLFFCMNHSYWSWLEQESGSVPDSVTWTLVQVLVSDSGVGIRFGRISWGTPNNTWRGREGGIMKMWHCINRSCKDQHSAIFPYPSTATRHLFFGINRRNEAFSFTDSDLALNCKEKSIKSINKKKDRISYWMKKQNHEM